VRDATAAILDRTTLEEVCRKIDETKEQGQSQEALMYYI
jgi:hypothetical protein